jgi:hypothetical protein
MHVAKGCQIFIRTARPPCRMNDGRGYMRL